jgi:hypothetical protein
LALQVWADRYNKGSLHTDYQLHYKWPSKEAYTAAAAAAPAAATTAAAAAPTSTAAAAAAAGDNSNNNESGDHRDAGEAPHGGESPVPNGHTNGQANTDSNQQQEQQQQQQGDTDVRSNNNNNNNNSVHSRGDRDSLDELYGNVNSAAGYASDTESAAAPATSLRGDTPSRDPLHAVELAAEHDAAAQQFTQRARADHVRELLRDATYVSEQVRTAALCAALLWYACSQRAESRFREKRYTRTSFYV